MLKQNTMQYCQDSPLNDDTIVAIATAFGSAAISVIRISGKKSLEIVSKIFSKSLVNSKSHTVHFGKILEDDGKILDTVLVIFMISPKSYTGEDVVEIQCHGGTLITERVFNRVIQAGARAANPGEFTFRAFLNGKLDLLQAEAVCDIISANNEISLKAANEQLEGHLSNEISQIQKELIDISAYVEASLDFPEEDLILQSSQNLKMRLKKIRASLEKLLSSFFDGSILNKGIDLAIIGSPNVGKSSLMNLLCKRERSIVTAIAGTTRDTVEDQIKIGPFLFNIIDTAGIRETEDQIELEGIKRSTKALQNADILLILLDASTGIKPEDKYLLEQIDNEKSIIVWNKIDLKIPEKEGVHISVKENIGIDILKEKIEQMAKKKMTFKEHYLIKMRHKIAIERALSFCEDSLRGLNENLSLEFIASDVRFCLSELNRIIGLEIDEEILSSIFSKFCIGK